MQLATDRNFSFSETHWFLDRNYDECLHHVTPGQITKALRIGDQKVLFRIREGLQIEILVGEDAPVIREAIHAFITEWFDLDRDIQPFYDQLSQHPVLAYMRDAYRGLRIVGIPDLFEAIAWSIIGQQINLTFAYKMKRRMVERYGDVISYEGRDYHIFPDAAVLAKADPAELRTMQFSARKAEYLIIAAAAFANGQISKDMIRALPDTATRQQALTALKGIGIWTANYSLMKSLQEQSAVPYGDAGLLNGLVKHGIIADKKDHAAIMAFFKAFPGWESYVVFYLWRSLAER